MTDRPKPAGGHPLAKPVVPQGQLTLFEGPRAEPPAFTVKVVARARRLTIRVYPGGRVVVTVPRGTAPLAIERFVARHRAWLDARIAEARLGSGPPTPPTVITLRSVDEEWRVVYQADARPGYRVRFPGVLEIGAAPGDVTAAKETLRRWLLAEGDRRLSPWLARLAGERGFSFARTQIRRQRTRWGSCSRSGTISLNACLVFQPPEVVEYLFVHELCHTRHMNHSARFWALVAAHEPRYRELDRALSKGWQHVPGWVYD